MIITITGKPGSGKSTMGKMLAEKYNLNYYSAGDFFRKRAKEKNMTLKEYSILAEKEREHDEATDNWQKELGEKEDNFVIEGRTGHIFIKNSVKIYLDITKEAGAKRIMEEKREDEKAMDFSHALHLWEHRFESEKIRYQNYYNLDIHNQTQYDFVLDTTNLSKEKVFKKLCEFIDGVKRTEKK